MSPVAEDGFTIKICEEKNGFKIRIESHLGSKEQFKTNFNLCDFYFNTTHSKEPFPRGYIKQRGNELFNTLLASEMKEDFRTCFRQCIQEGNPLRIVLESDSLKIHQIPWEILYCEDENLFLGSSPYVTFSRSIPDIPVVDINPVNPPMKLLVLVSSPLDLSPDDYEIDIGEVERLVNIPLEGLKSQGWISILFADDTRFDQVRRLMGKEWNIIHFVGHGFHDGEKSYILIEDDRRNKRSLPAEKVCDLFESRKRAHLILFSACESARIPLEINSGVPFILLKRGFPAIIAMQYSVFVEVADTFVKYLYEHLDKTTIDKAVSEARTALYQRYGEDNLSWFTPVLYGGLNSILKFERRVAVIPPEREKRVDFLKDIPRAEIFFGRKEYRLKIEEAFLEKKRRVILITGIGGIGKSSLAREYADRFREKYKAIFAKKIISDFNLKNFFKEMGEFLSANGDISFEEIIDSDISIRGKLEYLCDSLNTNRYLIILDGFEEIMENMKIKSSDMRILLEAFINGNHRSNIIIVSRYQLEEYEIECIDIGDLSKWSCWRILKEKRIDLDWQEIERIYKKMGGNPKYFDLVAPLIKRMGKENILKAMKDARKEIDVWLLDELFGLIPDEKEILEKVSVLRITFKRSALELAGATNEMVSNLLGLSLLKLDGFYSIHSIVRDYCNDRMTNKEKKRAHECAVKYYTQESEDENLLERHFHLLMTGKFEDAATIVFGITETLVREGYLDPAFHLNESALWETSQKTKSIAYHNMGMVHQRQSEYKKALEYFEKSLEIKEKIHYRKGIAETYHNIGMIHRDRGEYKKALKYFGKSLKTFKEIHDLRNIGRTYHQIGIIFQHVKKYEKARAYFNKSLKIFEKLNDKGNIGAVHHHIGIIFQYRGEYEKAREYFDRNLKVFENLHDIRGEAITYHHLGIIHQYKGEFEKALKYFNKSLEIKKKIHDTDAIGKTYGQLGRLYSKRKEYEKALKFFHAAYDIFHSIQSSYLESAKKDIAGIRNLIGEEEFKKLWEKTKKEKIIL